MFKDKTVFILGAGASKPYGYPLGKGLIKEIIENINKDDVYFPVLRNLGYFYNKNDAQEKDGKLARGYKSHDFLTALEETKISTFEGLAEQRIQSGMELFLPIGNTHYAQVKLDHIIEFRNLKDALLEYDPVSIDSFLRDNPSYKDVGQIMIIYSLLKYENTSYFSVSNDDNWYSYLINDILSGCKNPNNIFDNQFNIITFNYDLSLDYCLSKKLSNTEFLVRSGVATDFIEQLGSSRIKHVYGKLYGKEVGAYGSFLRSDIGSNMRRFLKAIQSRDQIKLINSERNNQDFDEIRNLISDASEIIIIGFAFDRDNLDVLGFPQSISGYADFFHGKKIKYMDYGGRMNGLYDQFKDIQGRNSNVLITRSTATRIIDAYQNDFKIYLYQQQH